MPGAISASNDPDNLKRKYPGASEMSVPQDQPAYSNASVSTACTGSQYDAVDEDESSSVEALLAVPIDFIFCESRPPAVGTAAGLSPPARGMATQPPPAASSHRRRTTLLSRSEASVLLRVNQLSVELDVLRSVASEALDRTRLYRDLRDRIKRGGRTAGGRIGSAYLRPLLPLLDVHGASISQRAVAHVASESGRVLSELGGCASALQQFAEQNWSMSEQLCEAFGYDEKGSSSTGTGLGREKRAVAEVEEAVSARIKGLVGMAAIEHGGGEGRTDDGCFDVFDVIGTDKDRGEFIPMRELCHQLLLGAGCELTKANGGEEPSVRNHHQKNNGDRDLACGASSREKSRDSDQATVESNFPSGERIDEKTKGQGVAIEESNRKLPSALLGKSDKLQITNGKSGTGMSTVKTSQNRRSNIGDDEVERGGSGTQDAVAALAVLASS